MPDFNKLQTAEPIILTDDSATLVASVLTSDPTESEPGLVVRDARKGQISFASTDGYAASNLFTNLAVPINTTYSLAYIWHPASVTKSYYIQKIVVSSDAGGGTTRMAARVTRITAENGTPGGTLITPIKLNSGSANSGATFRVGANAPTRATTDVFIRTFTGNLAATHIFDVPVDMTGPMCRGGVAEGWEVRLEVASPLLNALRLGVQVIWTEV